MLRLYKDMIEMWNDSFFRFAMILTSIVMLIFIIWSIILWHIGHRDLVIMGLGAVLVGLALGRMST